MEKERIDEETARQQILDGNIPIPVNYVPATVNQKRILTPSQMAFVTKLKMIAANTPKNTFPDSQASWQAIESLMQEKNFRFGEELAFALVVATTIQDPENPDTNLDDFEKKLEANPRSEEIKKVGAVMYRHLERGFKL